MTVCIAARSFGAVFILSDRMITAGDIQFEPAVSKIVFLTSSIAVMGAGDAAFHAEILTDVLKEVVARATVAPNEWWHVKDVVDLYIKYRNLAKLRRAEAAILAPLGLNRYTFLQSQKTMDAALVDTIARDLIAHSVPETEVLIVGIDNYVANGNPHIYSIFNDYVSCDDVVGFRAIGSGARHAESQFMLARHGWNSNTSDTILLAYRAKKNAEIAPGVGSETDMFMIGPQVGRNTPFGAEVMEKLDEGYRKIRDANHIVENEAHGEMKRYVDSLGQTETGQQSDKPSIEETEPSPDKKDQKPPAPAE